MRPPRSHEKSRLRVHAELKIWPGLLWSCVGGEAERAAVAMVRTGSGDIIEVWEVGIICQGRVGWWGSFKMPFSLTRQPLAPSLCCARSLGDSPSYFSVCLVFFPLLWSLSLVLLVTHSGRQTRQNAGEEVKTGESRWAELLVLQEKRR